MADVKWIKIAVDLFDDEKILLIEHMPRGSELLIVWIKLLCLAGKQNNSGVFMFNDKMPYTQDMLAKILRVNPEVLNMALDVFQGFGMVDIVNKALTIPKWGKHQSLEKIEKNNDYMRGYMREYRNKQKLISRGCKPASQLNGKTNSKPNVNPSEPEPEPEPELKPKLKTKGVRPLPAPPAHLDSFLKHGEYGWVKLTQRQQAQLREDLGQSEFDRCVLYLDEYAQGNGNKGKWKDWNLIMRKCSRERWGISKPWKNGEDRVEEEVIWAMDRKTVEDEEINWSIDKKTVEVEEVNWARDK